MVGIVDVVEILNGRLITTLQFHFIAYFVIQRVQYFHGFFIFIVVQMIFETHTQPVATASSE